MRGRRMRETAGRTRLPARNVIFTLFCSCCHQIRSPTVKFSTFTARLSPTCPLKPQKSGSEPFTKIVRYTKNHWVLQLFSEIPPGNCKRASQLKNAGRSSLRPAPLRPTYSTSYCGTRCFASVLLATTMNRPSSTWYAHVDRVMS